MTSFAFNPVTVALAGVSIVFVISVLIPADSWDRFKDWWRRADNRSEIIPPKSPQHWPWERKS